MLPVAQWLRCSDREGINALRKATVEVGNAGALSYLSSACVRSQGKDRLFSAQNRSLNAMADKKAATKTQVSEDKD
ncbi:MAG: hypothetical protein P8L85_00585, partial [Rubripirellula sp.]|nr:hypothetical protein [Rubripirellula sp.]